MGCLAGTGFLMLIMAFVRERWQVYLIACFGGVGSNTIVLLRAIITRCVAATVQGRVQGLMYVHACGSSARGVGAWLGLVTRTTHTTMPTTSPSSSDTAAAHAPQVLLAMRGVRGRPGDIYLCV